jgi:membrane protease YdiL (CAAX protease family)
MPSDERDLLPDAEAQLPTHGEGEGEPVAASTAVFCRRCGETSVPVANCCPWCNAWLVGEPPKVAPIYEVDDEPEDDWHTRVREEDYPAARTEPALQPDWVVSIAYFLLLATLLGFGIVAGLSGVTKESEMYGWMAAIGVFTGVMTLGALGLVWKSAKQKLPEGTLGLAWLVALPVLTALMIVNIAYISYMREYFKPFGAVQTEHIEVTLATILLICVQPAIVEELFFRQMMLGVFRKSYSTHTAVWLTGALFAFAHLGNPLGMPYLFLAGVVFGYARVFGGLPLPMVLHFLHNFIVIAYEAWWRGGGG